MHRYGATRGWSVGVLGIAAAAFAIVVSGGASLGFDAAQSQLSSLGPSLEGLSSAIGTAAAGPGPSRPSFGAASPAVARPATGDWQIQVGALRSAGAARALLDAVTREVPALAGLTRAPAPPGRLVRARIAGIADEAAATQLCVKLSAIGRDCFVVAPGR